MIRGLKHLTAMLVQWAFSPSTALLYSILIHGEKSLSSRSGYGSVPRT